MYVVYSDMYVCIVVCMYGMYGMYICMYVCIYVCIVCMVCMVCMYGCMIELVSD